MDTAAYATLGFQQTSSSGGYAIPINRALTIASESRATKFGSHTITSSARLTTLVLAKKPGQHVTITHTDHSGSTHTATVTLASDPPQ